METSESSPPLPNDIEQILSDSCPFWPKKKVRDTHLLVLIPNTVNGKPFTLNSLGEMIQNPKKGYNKTGYSLYSGDVKSALGEKNLSSHWVLMTREEIPNSFNEGYDAQKQRVASYAKKSGQPYELPKVLEAATAILMYYVSTGCRLYTDNHLTYIRCQERVNENQQPVAIGGFAGYTSRWGFTFGGLHVSSIDYDSHRVYYHYYAYRNGRSGLYGAAALRRF